MNVLVTGNAGFLGSHVSQYLLQAGHRVFGVDNLSGGSAANVIPGVWFYRDDICDEAAVEHIFVQNNIQAVVHCAAFASENLSHSCRLHTFRSIVMGTGTLINAAINHDVRVFVNMSSIAVYGNQPAPFRDLDIPYPNEPYGVGKSAAEADLRGAHDFFGLPYVIFRPHNIIGTRQNLADSTRNVASIFIRQALSGQPLTIFGDGLQTRAFSPVQDVARIIAASVDRHESWNQTYNIGGEQIWNVLRLAEVVSEVCGVPLNVQHLPERKEAKHAHSLHLRVARAFPDLLTQQQPIEECIREMVAEARKAPLPLVQALPRIEIQKLLNPVWKHQ